MRAVGFNPEAAGYAGMNVARNYIRVMLICGSSRGSPPREVQPVHQRHPDLADRLRRDRGGVLGRNTAGGTLAAALLFGALITGTSDRNLNPDVFDPTVGQYLTYVIERLIVLLGRPS